MNNRIKKNTNQTTYYSTNRTQSTTVNTQGNSKYIHGLLGGSLQTQVLDNLQLQQMSNLASVTDTDNGSASSSEEPDSAEILSPESANISPSSYELTGDFEKEEQIFQNSLVASILVKLKHQLKNDPAIDLEDFHEPAARTLFHVLNEHMKFHSFKKNNLSKKQFHILHYANELSPAMKATQNVDAFVMDEKAFDSSPLTRDTRSEEDLMKYRNLEYNTAPIHFDSDHSAHYNSRNKKYDKLNGELPTRLMSYKKHEIPFDDLSEFEIFIPNCLGYKNELIEPTNLIAILDNYYQRDKKGTLKINIILGEFDDMLIPRKEFLKNDIAAKTQAEWLNRWDKACEDFIAQNPNKQTGLTWERLRALKLNLDVNNNSDPTVSVSTQIYNKSPLQVFTHEQWMNSNFVKQVSDIYFNQILPGFAKEVVQSSVNFLKLQYKKNPRKKNSLSSPIQGKLLPRSPNMSGAVAPEPEAITLPHRDPMYLLFYQGALSALRSGNKEEMKDNFILAHHYHQTKSDILSVATNPNSLFGDQTSSPTSTGIRNHSPGSGNSTRALNPSRDPSNNINAVRVPSPGRLSNRK